MSVRQVSVFVENRAGRVAEVTGILAERAINVFGLSVSDQGEFGILRLMVDHPDLAADLLREAGLTVTLRDVVCVRLPDEPGSVARLAKILADAGINITNFYLGARESTILDTDDVGALEEILYYYDYASLTEADMSSRHHLE